MKDFIEPLCAAGTIWLAGILIVAFFGLAAGGLFGALVILAAIAWGLRR